MSCDAEARAMARAMAPTTQIASGWLPTPASTRLRAPRAGIPAPMSRIQWGIAYQTSPRGRPDANERRATAAVRQELMARARFESALSAPLTSAPRLVKLFHGLELRPLLFLAPPKLLSHDGRRALERRPSRVPRRAALRPSQNYRREIERNLLPHRER